MLMIIGSLTSLFTLLSVCSYRSILQENACLFFLHLSKFLFEGPLHFWIRMPINTFVQLILFQVFSDNLFFQASDYGNYSCVATNAVGTTSSFYPLSGKTNLFLVDFLYSHEHIVNLDSFITLKKSNCSMYVYFIQLLPLSSNKSVFRLGYRQSI